MSTILRPLNTGELLDRTFFLYRKHFTLFVGIVAIPHLLVLAIQVMQGVSIGLPSVYSAVWTLLSYVAYMLAISASTAGTVHAISNVHLDRPTSVTASLGAIRGMIFRIALITFAIYLGIGLGLILLVIPGIYLALKWSLAIPSAVVEDLGLRESTDRSGVLTEGDKGRIFVVYFLFVVLTYIVTLVWETPLLGMFGFRVSQLHTTMVPVWFTVGIAVGTFVTQCLVGPLLTIALSLIYYDQRVRKEAFDLQLMMASVDGQTSAAAATAGAS